MLQSTSVIMSQVSENYWSLRVEDWHEYQFDFWADGGKVKGNTFDIKLIFETDYTSVKVADNPDIASQKCHYGSSL